MFFSGAIKNAISEVVLAKLVLISLPKSHIFFIFQLLLSFFTCKRCSGVCSIK